MDAHKGKYPHAQKIGSHIRLLRKRQRLTTGKLGERSRMSQQQISAIERGAVNIPVETIAVLAEALGTTLAVLLTDEAVKALSASPPCDVRILAIELARACLKAPEKHVPEALRLFATELQRSPVQPEQEASRS
jgi:transcriptional regulator with XRE-family HTH domain